MEDVEKVETQAAWEVRDSSVGMFVDLLATRISQHSPFEGGERATCSKLAANAL